MKTLMVCLALASTAASAADTQVLDLCESRLRTCFAKCVSKGQPDTCNRECTTAKCEGLVGEHERTLTEFLSWRRTKGRIWA